MDFIKFVVKNKFLHQEFFVVSKIYSEISLRKANKIETFGIGIVWWVG